MVVDCVLTDEKEEEGPKGPENGDEVSEKMETTEGIVSTVGYGRYWVIEFIGIHRI